MEWNEMLIPKKQVKEGLIKELGIYGFSVYVVLKAYEGSSFVLTQKKIVELSGISRKKVNEVIQELKEKGLYEEVTKKPKINARVVLNMFLEEYKNKYEDNCPVNWGRDQAMIKKRIVEIYKQEDLEEIVKMSFKIYDKIGNISQYPRLTVGAFTSFIAEKAYQEILKERKRLPRQIKETKSNMEDKF